MADKPAAPTIADIESAIARGETVSLPTDGSAAEIYAYHTRAKPSVVWDAWHEVVREGLIVNHIFQNDHDTDPKKAIADLIAYEVALALDPRISKEAQQLVDSGTTQCVPEEELKQAKLWRQFVAHPRAITLTNYSNGAITVHRRIRSQEPYTDLNAAGVQDSEEYTAALIRLIEQALLEESERVQ